MNIGEEYSTWIKFRKLARIMQLLPIVWEVLLCFDEQKSASNQLTDEKIKEMYKDNKFEFILDINPGVRTRNDTFRKRIETGIEV